MATIDERVVSLKLNNKQFLSAIQESAAGMDKLKGSLSKVGESASGLKRIGEIARNTTLGDLAGSALDAASNMSVLQGVGVAALGGIAATAVQAGKSLVQSFIQPIMDGFSEYETQINAVQTILANTSQNGTTLDQVNASLEQLNTYADKTIYNFTEMTNAIGTFTVAGIGLEESTAAVKGFSNVAALSGANAQQAAGAMYQLAQAMSSGVVKLQDWMSIEKAGIGGKQFQEALIETARVYGQGVDAAIEKNGNFRLSLQEGWLTAEVMTTTLTALTNDLSEAQLVEMGYSEEQAAKMKELAQKAFDSATQIRTFTQMIGTWAEALGSGWSKTWQIILGDFGQAQALFTGIGNWVGSIIDEASDARNSFLEMWASLGGRDDLLRGLKNIFLSIFKIIGQLSTAFDRVFGGASAEGLARITKAFADFTEKLFITNNFADKLEWTFTGLFSVFHILWTVVSEVAQVIFTVASHIISALFPAFAGVNSGVFQITKVIGKVIYAFDQWFTRLDIGGKLLKFLIPPIDLLGKVISWVVGKIHDFFMWLDIGGKVTAAGAAIKGLSDKFAALKDSFKNSALGQQFAEAIDSIHNAVDKAKNKISEFGQMVGDKLKNKFDAGKNAVINYFKGFDLGNIVSMQDVLDAVGKKFDQLAEKLKISERIQWLKEKLLELRDSLVELWHEVQNSSAWKTLGDAFSKAGDKVTGLASSFQDWVNKHKNVKSAAGATATAVASVGDAAQGAAQKAGEAAKESFFKKWLDDLKRLAEQLHLPELFESVKQKLIEIKNLFTQTIGPKIKEGATQAFGAIGDALGKANENLKSYDMGKILITAIGGSMMVAIVKWVNTFKENLEKQNNLIDKVSETFDKLGGVLEAFQQQVKAEALIKIAIAIGLLTLALLVMSLVPFKKLVQGVVALGIVMKMLMMTMEQLNSMDIKGIWEVMPVLMALGVTLVLIAAAIAILGKMNAADAIQGVIAFRVVMAILIEALDSISKNKTAAEGAAVILALALAANMFAIAVLILGSMPTDTAIQGVIALGAVVAILAGFMYIVTKNPNMATGAAVLMGLAVAVNLLVGAIWILGSMDTGKLLQGAIAVGAIIVVLGAALMAAGATRSTAAGSIIAMAVAVIALSFAVEKLGNMDTVSLVKGIVALAAGLAILVAAMYGAEIFQTGAIALSIAAVAVAIFGNSLKSLAELSWIQIAAGLIALAGGLAIMLAAAWVAQMVAPGLIILTAVLIALGIAMLPVSIALAGFALILGIAATAGAAAFVVLAEGIKMLSALLPQLAIDLANAIANFIITLGSKAPEIGVAIAQLMAAAIYAIVVNTPGVVHALFVLIQALMTEIDSHAEEFGEKAAGTIAKFIQGIANKLPDVIDAGTNLIIAFLDGIGNSFPKILDKAGETIVKFLDGIEQAITKYAPQIRQKGIDIAYAIVNGITGGLLDKASEVKDELVNLCSKAYNGAKDFFGIKSPSRLMRGFGHYVGEGLAIGIDKSTDRVEAASVGMANAAYEAMKASFDKVNELVEDDPSFQPNIKPVLDLEELQKQAQAINGLGGSLGVSTNLANGARPKLNLETDPGQAPTSPVTNVTFNQNNYSPESLSESEIYRQTHNQLARARRILNS